MEGSLHRLQKELKQKDKTIASLKKRLSQYENPDENMSPPKKNSENSDIPTSQENLPNQIKHRTTTPRQPSGRKPGAQEGQADCTLTKTDTPDEIMLEAPQVHNQCRCELGGTGIQEIAVTDRHSSYFKLDFTDSQVPLRNHQYHEDLTGENPWPKTVARVLLDVLEERKANPSVGLSVNINGERLDRLIERRLTGAPKPFIALRNGIMRRKEYTFTLLENPGPHRAITQQN